MVGDFGEGSRKQGFILDRMLSESRGNYDWVEFSLEKAQKHTSQGFSHSPASAMVHKARV